MGYEEAEMVSGDFDRRNDWVMVRRHGKGVCEADSQRQDHERFDNYNWIIRTITLVLTFSRTINVQIPLL